MAKLLINNGRVIDPASGRDEVLDVLIEGGVIKEISERIEVTGDLELYDADGKWVIPGVIDLHVHLRDLNQANKETIETGTMAARKGGVTTVFAMPNTVPRLDNTETIKDYQNLIDDYAAVETHIVGAITEHLLGEKLAALNSYKQHGITMVSDDGYDVNNEGLLKDAYKKCKKLGLLLVTHPEMTSIAPDGVINEGVVSEELKVPGQPNEKEWKAVERGIKLALKTGARAHFTHVSTKESLELVREAKKESDLITCDVTPHHITFTDELVLKEHGMAKVNPPLRSEADRQALIEGIKDGTVDAIATDHAPHTREEKLHKLTEAAFGFVGLETLIPSVLTQLHIKEGIDLLTIIRLMTIGPATIAGLDTGRIAEGARADLTIIDPEMEEKVNPHDFVSKGRNTPFEGMILKGWPVATIYKGEVY